MTFAFKDIALSKEAENVEVHFTINGEGLNAQRNYHGWKTNMNSYMVDYKYCFMVCSTLRQARLQEVGMTQIPTYYAS